MDAQRTGVLVICHGQLGEALLETAAMIIGGTPKAYAIGFLEGQGVEDLDAAVRGAVARLDSGDDVLCLVDLSGGSPARVLGGLVIGSQFKMEVVTGVNLPMLLEALLRRSDMQLEALAEYVARAGSDGILNLRSALRAAAAQNSPEGTASAN